MGTATQATIIVVGAALAVGAAIGVGFLMLPAEEGETASATAHEASQPARKPEMIESERNAAEEAARAEQAEGQAALASEAPAAGRQISDLVLRARAAIDRADWNQAESAVTSAQEVLRPFQEAGQPGLVSAEATTGLTAVAAEVRTHRRKEHSALIQEEMASLLQEATEARKAERWDDASTAIEKAMGLVGGHEGSGAEAFIADATKAQAESLAAEIRGYFERKAATEDAEKALAGPAAYRCDGGIPELVAHWETAQQHAEYAPDKAKKLQRKLETCRKKQVREYRAALRSAMQTMREFNRDQYEKAALGLGLDFDFAIVGKKTLRIKYALFSKAFVYQLTNGFSFADGDLLHTYQEGGFSRVIFTDGWNFRLAFDLNPPDEGAILREQLQEFEIAEPFVL